MIQIRDTGTEVLIVYLFPGPVRSYIAKEQAERAELEVEGEQTLMEMEHNADLIQQGEGLI